MRKTKENRRKLHSLLVFLGAVLEDHIKATAAAIGQHIQRLEYSIDTGMGSRARLGLMVLQTDQTIEAELKKLISLDGVATYHARLANDAIVTPETLARMQNELPTAAKLLPQEFGFSAIAYACTSGSSMIG